MRSKQASALLFTLLAGLLSHSLVIPVFSSTIADQKSYYSPDPHAGTPPTGTHNNPMPPPHGYGGTPPHQPTPTPSTPLNPPSGGGGYYNPPSSGGGSPPTTPVDPGTPSIPSSNFRAEQSTLIMAEETTPQLAENDPEVTNSATEDMELETSEPGAEPKGLNGDSEANEAAPETNGDANSKREREEETADENIGEAKKPKVEKSVEEERMEKVEGDGKGDEKSGPVSLGPKSFGSSVEMFDYFYKFLHYWPANLNLNEYEQMVLLELLKKGHVEPEKKIGCGIHAFQIRNHPTFKSKCYFLIREDESVDDFSFRKCVDHILPLPENLKVKSDANRALGGCKHRGGGRGGGGGRGRGGRSRN